MDRWTRHQLLLRLLQRQIVRPLLPRQRHPRRCQLLLRLPDRHCVCPLLLRQRQPRRCQLLLRLPDRHCVCPLLVGQCLLQVGLRLRQRVLGLPTEPAPPASQPPGPRQVRSVSHNQGTQLGRGGSSGRAPLSVVCFSLHRGAPPLVPAGHRRVERPAGFDALRAVPDSQRHGGHEQLEKRQRQRKTERERERDRDRETHTETEIDRY